MIFHNFGEDLDTFLDDASTSDTKLVDVALRTSAAPICFPVYQGYIDGGFYANNPSMCALTLALDRSGKRSTRARPLPESPAEIVMLSLGEGLTRRYLPGRTEHWGWGHWLIDSRQPLALLDVAIDSNGEIIDYQCRRLLGEDQYHRLDPDAPKIKTRMSIEAEIPIFYESALEVDLNPTVEWLDTSQWFDQPASAEAAGTVAARSRRRNTTTPQESND
jgi:patatin-like phospholipase/acyl hydrolase